MGSFSRETKERGAHFTPRDIAIYIAEGLYGMLVNPPHNISVLDPACGDGELLLAMFAVLKQHGHNVSLIGVDSDMPTLSLAEHRVMSTISPADSFRFVNADFLECEPFHAPQPDNSEREKLAPHIAPVDIIIANPPYVRTQIIGAQKSRFLANKYGLTGKTDLYYAFFIAYKSFLKDGGALGVITSNKYLYNKSGAAVREFIRSAYRIEYLADLGDTKVFEAAVLPAILFARNTAPSLKPVECQRVYETNQDAHAIRAESIADILRSDVEGAYEVGGKVYLKETGHVRRTEQSKEPWMLCSISDEAWLKRIDDAASCKLGDIAKVRVGIKTTADNVFIRENWQDLPNDRVPERELIKPLISSKDATRWQLERDPVKSVLYTHTIIDGKRAPVDLERYPHAKNYLMTHFEQLDGRSYVKKAKRKWYELWVPQDPKAWGFHKVVFPDISDRAKFLYDATGAAVDGNCYWITLNEGVDQDYLYLILAVANSALMDRYHDMAFQNRLYSGKRRYLTQYVSCYPLPDLYTDSAQNLVRYVRKQLDDGLEIDEKWVDEHIEDCFNMSVR